MFVNPDPVADFVINDTSQCITGNSFVFTDNSFISSGTLIYAWSFGDFGSDNSSSPPAHTYSTADTFDVRLVLASNLGCRDTATKQVVVTPEPDPSFTGLAAQLCFNGPAVTLVPVTPSGTFSGDNVSGSDFSPAQLGWNVVQYAVTVNGCSDTARDSTFVVPAPDFDLGPDTTFCKEDFYTLNVTTPGATYLWKPDNSKNASYRVTAPGLYIVAVTNACGTVSDSVRVAYLDFACDMFIANAFTPEGNTVNDYFAPYIDTLVVKGMEFMVYDRWGTEVFSTTDLHTLGWDGNFNGSPSPEGVYIYILKLSLLREDTQLLKTLKGNFSLLR
jgi:gliding motility-associated-like protein